MKQKISGKRLVFLLMMLCCALYFTSYLTRLNFSAVLANMLEEGVFTKAQGGLIGSALFVCYGVGQLVSGYLGDKIKPSAIILTGLGTTLLCNFVMPLCPSFMPMMLVWGLNGFAQSTFWPPLVKLMTEYLDGDTYRRVSLNVTVASQAATVFIYLAVPVCLRLWGWRSCFYLASLGAAAMVTFWIVGMAGFRKGAQAELALAAPPESPVEKPGGIPASPRGSLWRAMLLCGMPAIALAIAAQGFLRDGITTWLPTYVVEVFHTDSAAAILSSVVVPIFNIVSMRVAVFVYFKIFRNELTQSIAFFGLGTLASALLALFSNANMVLSLVLAAIVTSSLHTVNVMLISYVPAHFEKVGKVSTVSGLTNACTYVGSTLSSFGLALMADAWGWRPVIVSWAGICLLGLALCFLVLKKWNHFAGESNFAPRT